MEGLTQASDRQGQGHCLNTQNNPIAENDPVPQVSSAQMGRAFCSEASLCGFLGHTGHILRMDRCHQEDVVMCGLTLGFVEHSDIIKTLENWFSTCKLRLL